MPKARPINFPPTLPSPRALPEDGPVFVDERPQYQSRLEWWFVQGRYGGLDLESRYFMVSLFRHRLGRLPRHGFTALLATLPAGAPRAAYRSLVDNQVATYFAGLGRRADFGGLDKALVRGSLRMLAQEGPPRPLEVFREPTKLEASGLDIAWADISLRQGEGAIALGFNEPGSAQSCALDLRPLSPGMEVSLPPQAKRVIGEMPYRCYPRVALAGTVGGREVLGEAWLDHQWGDYNWLVSSRGREAVLGWDWFGVNLDDGTDLVIWQHRDMRRRRLVARHATRLLPDGHKQVTERFSTRPTRFWTSPETWVTYPTAWRVSLPEWGLQLEVEALCPEQEIRILGTARTVWEGAARVEAISGRASLGGQARLELFGYGFVFDLQAAMGRVAAGMERRLRNFIPSSLPAGKPASPGLAGWRYPRLHYQRVLGEPTWDLLVRGGKRWRPLFGMMLLEAMGRSARPYEDLVAVLGELPHSGALIIDDIQDNSLLRRGQPSLHLKYGTATAINVANALYFLPFNLLAEHLSLSPGQRQAIFGIITRRFVEAHFGQGMDILLGEQLRGGELPPRAARTALGQVLRVYAQKTGALPAGMAEVAGVIAEAPSHLVAAATNFAGSLGVAFQIMDDVLNFCPQGEWTKTCGEDISEGKASYVMLHALANLPARPAKRLYQVLRDPALRADPEAVGDAMELVRASGVLVGCQKKAWRLFRGSWAPMAKLLPPSEAKLLLWLLGANLLRKLNPEGSPVS